MCILKYILRKHTNKELVEWHSSGNGNKILISMVDGIPNLEHVDSSGKETNDKVILDIKDLVYIISKIIKLSIKTYKINNN